MSLRSILESHAEFTQVDDVFYQQGIEHNIVFEARYQRIRDSEQRLYSDESLRTLPTVPNNHLYADEWKMRADSSMQLAQYVERNSLRTILEVGCGNGWLSNQLASLHGVEVLGLDICANELQQAARVFKRPQLVFARANVLNLLLENLFDGIVLASSLQYFPDRKALITSLRTLLMPHGEIHILDSPIYKTGYEANEARERSISYFKLRNNQEMAAHYFHPTFDDLGKEIELIYDPSDWKLKLSRKVGNKYRSPFPWIRLKK